MINRDTPIFLVGYMGAGKSTIGRRLADRMERKFIDTDIFIEQRFHESVANMFASVGEEAFRRREVVVIEELSGFPNAVIATGGGLPCHHGNMELMNQCGVTIFLQVSLDNLAKRIELCKRTRPTVSHLSGEALEEHIRQAMEVRLPIYRQAQYTIPCDEICTPKDEDQVAEQIALLLAR